MPRHDTPREWVALALPAQHLARVLQSLFVASCEQCFRVDDVFRPDPPVVGHAPAAAAFVIRKLQALVYTTQPGVRLDFDAAQLLCVDLVQHLRQLALDHMGPGSPLAEEHGEDIVERCRDAVWAFIRRLHEGAASVDDT